MKASQYFQHFEVKVKYKSEKRNIILDILSRFVNINESLLSSHHIKFNTLNVYIYVTILIEINNNFKKRIIKNY